MAFLQVPAPLNPMHALRVALQDGFLAARSNARPAAVLVLFGLVLILGYEFIDPLHRALNAVADLRIRVGLEFPILTTALFGGALPLVLRRFLLQRPASFDEVIFSVVFWGYKGLEVALFYDFQAWLWGADRQPSTLFLKVLTDQLLYAPLIAVPNMVLGYLWLHSGFSFRRARRALRDKSFLSRALPILLSNAVLWIPAATLIYLFPTPLQLPIQNLVLAFWVLVLLLLARPTP
jgi:hypothetical protein